MTTKMTELTEKTKLIMTVRWQQNKKKKKVENLPANIASWTWMDGDGSYRDKYA